MIAAFRWLSRRPRITGKAVEKLLGHAVHFMMLKRELLSCFRSLYDFVQAKYVSRTRLWQSTAREAAWASHLLLVCHANLRRPWDDQVTASDASLSGIAVCTRQAHAEEVARLARVKETWRFKARDFVPPRETALKTVELCDPFEDPNTVKPIHLLPEDPFTFNLNFEEIPQSFMEPQEWCDTFSSPMRIAEPITILEARGVIAAVRHKCRAVRSFGKRHLHLNDNLANVLCLEKGRSSSFSMLRACRRLCALLVAANCSVHHRWVPSELNPADHASRQWEGERKSIQRAREVR